MPTPCYHTLGDNIVCIDALYTAPGTACCYLIGSAGEYALIETGTARSIDNILATFAALGVELSQLRYVIPTHVHLDHAGGAGQLMAMAPEATLLIHPRGARHMIDPARLVASSIAVYGEAAFAKLYGEILPISESRVRTLDDGESVQLGTRTLRVLHTRGHAEHHFCLYDELSESWFTGDMFGISYPTLRFAGNALLLPATTPTQFDPQAYITSVEALGAAHPRNCYLTHFSALPFEERHVEMLRRQLLAYAELGDSNSSAESIVDRILALAEAEARALTDAASAAAAVAALKMDAALNAQGIIWWRDRQRASAVS